MNVFWGADVPRVMGDLLYSVDVNHYRMTVHPLFLILVNPFVMLVHGLVMHIPSSVVVAEAIVGGIATVGIFQIAGRYLRKELSKLLIAGLYLFSFSTMIFGTIPETYIFAGAFLILFWNYALRKIQTREELEKNDYIILVACGLTSFGVTMTNYMSYVIGFFAILLVCVSTWKKRVQVFLGINALNLLIVSVLAKLQQFAWRWGTPYFWDSIIAWVTGTGNSQEEEYIHVQFSLFQLKMEFDNLLVHGLFGNRISLWVESKDVWGLQFEAVHPIFYLIIIGLLVAIIATVVACVVKKEYHVEVIALTLVLLSNYALHYLYGPNEAFIYTQHFYFAFFLIMAIGLALCKESLLLQVGLFGFVIFEFVTNMISYRHVIQLLSDGTGIEIIKVKDTIGMTFFVCCMILLIGSVVIRMVRGLIAIGSYEYRKIGATVAVLYFMFMLLTSISVTAYSIMIGV
jgi:hypothetical protein